MIHLSPAGRHFQQEYAQASRSTDLMERVAVMTKYGVICQNCGRMLGEVTGQPRVCHSCEERQRLEWAKNGCSSKAGTN